MINPRHQLFTLNTLIAACLNEVRRLKSLTVQTEQYELAGQLREVEQICQSIEADIAFGIYPSVADQVIKSEKVNYFDLLFKYGYLQKWKNISGNFDVALALRKKLLNGTFVLRDDQKEKFNSLNEMMTGREASVNDFYDAVKQKACDNPVNENESAFAIIKCYAYKTAYSFLYLNPDRRKPFYQFAIMHGQWMKDPDQAKKNGSIDYQKVKEYQFFMQAMELQNEPCFTFSFLAMQGYLAWEDLMNIESMEVEVRVGCTFTRN